ncbi:GNAT family N-acetyltransferase [Clostridioides difficile]|uniref:GNAT family N-acetyltransferase n=1 Tax=Clostridioides difficile TaxID=1496 RepID=UPI000D1F896E|nr:GNAT family N-acetyltransferase [Clostridioides difficile]MDL5066186.1 GNAT family N-acetyltransferase [Clostridioides difficile]MDN9454722.1 GNAT family N-acetyltransferase [Clostridioides difficile]HBF7898020.1 GNAT family N-acetyltransferase [Clostridioides difficile]
MNSIVQLLPLEDCDREQFIKDNQEAFNFGAMEEFGLRDEHFEEEGQIISRDTIEQSINNGQAYRIVDEADNFVGGAVIKVEADKGNLDLLFVSPSVHSKGIGYAAWCEIEKLYPEVKKWETITPYFEQRNIHFYVNRCGFHIVEFFNKFHPDPNETDMDFEESNEQFPDGMFRFEKIID